MVQIEQKKDAVAIPLRWYFNTSIVAHLLMKKEKTLEPLETKRICVATIRSHWNDFSAALRKKKKNVRTRNCQAYSAYQPIDRRYDAVLAAVSGPSARLNIAQTDIECFNDNGKRQRDIGVGFDIDAFGQMKHVGIL